MKGLTRSLFIVICVITLFSPVKGQSTSNDIIIWKIDSLDIPNCLPCDQIGLKVNLLFGEEVNIGDQLILSKSKLFHISLEGDTLNINNYEIDDNSLKIYGSDWVDWANVIKKTDNNLILKKPQSITYELGTEPPPNDLIIYLTK